MDDPDWLRPAIRPPADLSRALESSAAIMRAAIAEVQPTHIVSMVSGGRDSAASHAIGVELGPPVDLILHGRTRTGIPETTQFVERVYGSAGPDFAVADAGSAYESYVMRKGFFGIGRQAHNFSYRILKADPFRAAISRLLRRGRRGIRILLINGSRADESDNRRRNLPVMRDDKGNTWVNIIHDWTDGDRDEFLRRREVEINPVAVQLCRSGECMCGTMQTAAERAEAAVLYPAWGGWLSELEREARAKHGFGWGEPFPTPRDPLQGDLFQPMCAGCVRTAPLREVA